MVVMLLVSLSTGCGDNHANNGETPQNDDEDSPHKELVLDDENPAENPLIWEVPQDYDQEKTFVDISTAPIKLTVDNDEFFDEENKLFDIWGYLAKIGYKPMAEEEKLIAGLSPDGKSRGFFYEASGYTVYIYESPRVANVLVVHIKESGEHNNIKYFLRTNTYLAQSFTAEIKDFFEGEKYSDTEHPGWHSGVTEYFIKFIGPICQTAYDAKTTRNPVVKKALDFEIGVFDQYDSLIRSFHCEFCIPDPDAGPEMIGFKYPIWFDYTGTN